MPPMTPAELAQNKGPQLLAIYVAFTIPPVILVTLRIMARYMTHTSLWYDDWFLIVATVGFVHLEE